MEPVETKPPATASHFTILVYSFQYCFSDNARVSSFHALAGRWHHWWGRLHEDAALATALDDIYFFLPHVHRLLFPETALLPEGERPARLAEARRLASLALEKLAPLISPDAALRLTYDTRRLEPLRRLELSFVLKGHDGTVRDHFAAPFELEWVDAMLFPQCVGLLMLKVRLREADLDVARINDFHFYLRPIHPPKLDWQLADWRVSETSPAVLAKARDVIDYLLEGLTGKVDPSSASLKAAVADFGRLGEEARPTGTPFGNVYGQSFHLYHYSCLAGAQPPDWPSGPFHSPSERALYELATCTDTRLPDYYPDESYLRNLMSRHRIAIWSNWQGMALHDNVVFLGLREGQLTLRDLPHNIENDYFYLYLVTLFYKIRLSVLAGEMMGRDDQFGDRAVRARRLWEEFRIFQDDHWFDELTHKPQGIEILHRFREGLGIAPIFRELRGKVREYQEFYELKLERQVSDLLALLTFIWVPAGALCSLFGSALGFQATWGQFIGWLGGVWLVMAAIWLLWTRRPEIIDSSDETFEADSGQDGDSAQSPRRQGT